MAMKVTSKSSSLMAGCLVLFMLIDSAISMMDASQGETVVTQGRAG